MTKAILTPTAAPSWSLHARVRSSHPRQELAPPSVLWPELARPRRHLSKLTTSWPRLLTSVACVRAAARPYVQPCVLSAPSPHVRGCLAFQRAELVTGACHHHCHCWLQAGEPAIGMFVVVACSSCVAHNLLDEMPEYEEVNLRCVDVKTDK